MTTRREWEAVQASARAGSCVAQFEVGLGLLHGLRDRRGAKLVSPVPTLAVAWLSQAASERHAGAMLTLGYCFDVGVGVRTNRKRALYWYRAAWRSGGDPSAANNIGTVYRAMKRYRRAFLWFVRAARSGDGDASVEVAQCYLSGRGVRRDAVLAVGELRKAVHSAAMTASGQDEAKYLLGLCYRDGRGVRRSLRTARRWLFEASRDGDHPRAEAALRALETAAA
jgi:TPR repeat protein